MEPIPQTAFISAVMLRKIYSECSGQPLDDNQPPEIKAEECLNAISKAISRGKWATVVLYRNELLQLVDRKGRTILLREMHKGHIENARGLIEKDIALLSHDINRSGSLHYAAMRDVGLVGLCLQGGVAINGPNRFQQTPLHLAIESGKSDIVKILIGLGADRNCKSTYKNLALRPLEYAVALGRIECFRILAEGRTLSRFRTPIGNLCHLAVYFHQNEMLKELLKLPERNIFLDDENDEENTPFALAVIVSNIEGANILYRGNAKINTQNDKGRSPLHLAVLNDQLDLVRALVQWGCKVTLRDADQLIPEALSRAQGKKRICNFLGNFFVAMGNREFEPPNFMHERPKNLAIMGGGPKGIAYVSAISVLHDKGLLADVERIAGTSAGAITALLLSFDYSPAEMKANLLKVDLESFLDFRRPSKGKVFSTITTLLGDFFLNFSKVRLSDFANHPLKAFFPGWFETGLCEGIKLRTWFEDRIQEKTKSIKKPEGDRLFTFGDLRKSIEGGNEKKFRHLHVFAIRVNKDKPPELVCFNSEDQKYDDVVIADAIRASMSIPFVFDACKVRTRNIRGETSIDENLGSFLDGGLVKNLPIDAFDTRGYQEKGLQQDVRGFPIFNKRTLGLALCDPPQEVKNEKVAASESWPDIAKGVAKTFYSAESMLSKNIPFHQYRVIEISNCGVGLTDFNMPQEKKDELLGSGSSATISFLNKQCEAPQLISPLEIPQLQSALQCKVGLEILEEPNLYFVGREKLLQDMKASLIDKGHGVCLLGPSGIGKTELALKFIERHSTRFYWVVRIDCSDAEEKKRVYSQLATELHFPIENLSLEELIQKVHNHLEEKENKPWLLFFDQVSEPIRLPQCKGGVVLVASTVKQKKLDTIKVPLLSEEESNGLIQMITKKDVVDDRAQKLGYHPLLIEQFSQWAVESPGLPLEQYNLNSIRGRYKKSPQQAIKSTLDHLSSEAREWLKICSFLDPQFISNVLLEDWITTDRKQVSLDQIKESLEPSLLINFQGAHMTLSPVIQAGIQQESSDESFLAALGLIERVSRTDNMTPHLMMLFSHPRLKKIVSQKEQSLLEKMNGDDFKQGNKEILQSFRTALGGHSPSQEERLKLQKHFDETCKMQ